MTQDASLKKFLERAINLKYSPEVLANRTTQNPKFKKKICTNTINIPTEIELNKKLNIGKWAP